MIIMCVFPLCEIGMGYGPLWIARKLDSNWTNDSYKTKTTNMQRYIDIYSGPAYMIHFKYSGIMNITFITMMYGMGQPILFLIAAISFFILYTQERILVAYFYQMPPSFDD